MAEYNVAGADELETVAGLGAPSVLADRGDSRGF